MKTSRRLFVAGRATWLPVAIVVLAALPSGCFRSRLLNPSKVCPPDDPACTPQPGQDGGTDGKPGGKPDAGADAVRDAGRDGGRDVASDGGDAKLDTLVDGNRDAAKDGKPDAFVCATLETCDNGIDDDCNGYFDCFDPACRAKPACIDRKQETCGNGIDDDGNGLIDCKDPACFGDKACVTPGREICNNNLDDDGDGLIDCADSDCAKDTTCVVAPGDEICDNGKDDNGDKLVDCSDPKCKTFAACLQSACKADVDFGAIASSGASVTRTLNTAGAGATFTTCAAPGGVARVGSFTLAAAADVRLDFTQVTGAAHVVAVFRAGVGQACDANQVGDCLAVGDKASATHTYNALAAGSYWVIVQSFPGTTGSTTVTLSTGKTGSPEVCDNGIDDDKDGATDCADLDCAKATTCAPCVPEINVGTLIVNGPSKTATVDTTKGANRYHPATAGTSTGKDIVVQFSTKETAGLAIEVWQTSGDHVYGIYQVPPAGRACDAVYLDGADLNGDYHSLTDWTLFAPGDYLIIFKARAAGEEGTLSVTLSAFGTRGIELCDNQLDDDSDGLIDCADPDCYGLPACAANMCAPDGDLGDLDIGGRVSVHVDLTSATRVFDTECSRGDGRGRAYRLNLLKPMMLDFFCTESGSQILAVSPQLSPLDACDAHVSDCADPNVGNIGCNFGLPSLQPGVYFVIVQAFARGNEGVVDLTLRGEAQRVDEICNNGIDDDGDGYVDCNDRKCVTSSYCQSARCSPGKDLGLLPLDGSTLSAAVQTSGASDDQTKSKCVSGPGGADAVLGFQLPGLTDLTIEWAQVGNHALVLYQSDNVPLPCEANQLVDCKATGGTSTGNYTLTGLAAGTYYLVIDADKAGSEGGVVVQISGKSAR